jgi:putative transposase
MTGEGKLIPDFDPCYQALGDSAEEQRSRYLGYLNTEIPSGECAFIQEAVDRGQLTGNGRYIEEVERIIGRRIEHRRPGRPKKDK